MTPLLVCRAAGSPGLGHLVRSAALAQAWADAGGRSLVSAARAVPPAAELVDDVELVLEAHDDWLERTVGRRPAWVLVDDPVVREDAVAVLRSAGIRVIVLDDHGVRGGRGADLVLDQNLGADPGGVRYALLRRPFRVVPRCSDGGRVIVLLGGDPAGSTMAFAADLLGKLAAEGVGVDVVAGGGALPAVPDGVRVHPYVADPSRLLGGAAVAVSTAGSSAWELCRTGVAPVLVSVADDQEPVGAALEAAGAASYLGRLGAVDPAAVADAALALLADAGTRARLASAGAALVDGRGTTRVVTRLRSALVSLRPVVMADAALLFAWANDPDTRAASLSTDPIPWAHHVRWLSRRLERPGAPAWIAELDGRPIGQVRFDPQGPTIAEISVSLAAEARGRHLAAPVIAAGCMAAFASDPSLEVVDARVRVENERSARSFLAADFDPVEAVVASEDVLRFRLHREGRWR